MTTKKSCGRGGAGQGRPLINAHHYRVMMSLALCRTLRVGSRYLRLQSLPGESLRGASSFPPLSSSVGLRASPRGVRFFRSTPSLCGTSEDLETAKEKLSTLTEDPGNEVKLKLYGLFKQVNTILSYILWLMVVLPRLLWAHAIPRSQEGWTLLTWPSGRLGIHWVHCLRCVFVCVI